ncbi:DUF2845 domain-containing protein [Dongshaea marina]|uniref:DUF2845 domain-containing protein n=1 Tax=Dongshaea marina TaxID=2047966 RepID=UPI00131EE969|nr:DUF2845 domain-containing protein [Dongshaea marina]
MKTLITMLVTLMFCASVSAASMRCGSKIIQEGTSAAKVLEYCGTPLESGAASVSASDNNQTWTYDHGSTHMIHQLHLTNGVVTAIRDLPRN